MEDKPSGPRFAIPTWAWIIVILGLILGLQFWLSGRFSAPPPVPLSDVVTLINDGDVTEIEVNGNKVTVTTEDGEAITTIKDEGSVIEQLGNLGISEETLSTTPIFFNDPSAWNTIITILISVGPVILLIWIFSRSFRQMQGGGGNSIFNFGRTKAVRSYN